MVKKRICPKCKSKDIKEDLSALQVNQRFALSRFVCNKCGNTGIFPEID